MAEVKDREEQELITHQEPAAAQQDTPVAQQQAAPPAAIPAMPVVSPGIKKRSRARARRRVKRIISLVVALAILGGIAFGLYKLFYEGEAALGEAATQFIYRGSISSMVSGSGQTKPKDSATITLTSGGTVLEVFVKDGDMVTEGDPLYVIDSSAAVEAVEAAQKTVDNYQKQLDAIMKSYNDLTVHAEYKGILLDTADIRVGDSVLSGTKLATLVDDSKMKLELYFSYAYEDMIKVGQSASVSIPATMNEIPGVVSEVNFVQRITPEGAILFQAIIEAANPGSLTEGMGASATLTSPDGEAIYPYEGGELKYFRKTDIVTKVSGSALSVNLLNYSKVSSGQLLLSIGADMNDDATATVENQLKTAREALAKAQNSLNNFNASAPMSGTILSCTLVAGETVDSGRVAVTIANTVTMIVDAQIDEMNVAYVKPGMFCEIMQWGRNEVQTFFGMIESVSLEGRFENGRAYFPAVISVDNYDGNLMPGMYVDYSLVASQSDDCLIAPIQAVKYTEIGELVFVRSETRPDNAIEGDIAGFTVPEGFYAVPVVIGISDNYSVEIISGVEEGAEVFTQYMPSQNGPGGGGGMIMRG